MRGLNETIKFGVLLFAASIAFGCYAADSTSVATKAGATEAVDGSASQNGKGRDDSRRQGVRFLVFYTIDFGYGLYSPNDLDVVIFPVFDDANILSEFNTFFAQKNLKSLVGKKIYCDCVGRMQDGKSFFRIKKAFLFAE